MNDFNATNHGNPQVNKTTAAVVDTITCITWREFGQTNGHPEDQITGGIFQLSPSTVNTREQSTRENLTAVRLSWDCIHYTTNPQQKMGHKKRSRKSMMHFLILEKRHIQSIVQFWETAFD